jgi:hypothetical protein
MREYERCFKFAIEMAYSGLTKYGKIRGNRSEVQLADDVILGILVEMGLKKFLKKKFDLEITLDMDVHTGVITPQDVIGVIEKGKQRIPALDLGVKGSKYKSCFMVLGKNEYEKKGRKSDAYIFGRVDLPSDHLFRILRNHSFFKKARNTLEKWKKKHPDDRKRKTIDGLKTINVWICGYSWHKELNRRKSIPGQKFEDFRYVKNVKDMHNSDKDWSKLIKNL